MSTYVSILAGSLNDAFVTPSGRTVYTLCIQNYMHNDFWSWRPILPTLISNTGKALLEHVAHRPAHAAWTPPGNLFDPKELWTHKDLHLHCNPGWLICTLKLANCWSILSFLNLSVDNRAWIIISLGYCRYLAASLHMLPNSAGAKPSQVENHWPRV